MNTATQTDITPLRNLHTDTQTMRPNTHTPSKSESKHLPTPISIAWKRFENAHKAHTCSQDVALARMIFAIDPFQREPKGYMRAYSAREYVADFFRGFWRK